MPRTRSLAWSELKIGFLALTALGLAAMFIYYVGGQGGFFWQQYHLKARFGDVMGLQTGAAVRVAGVTVGKVADMNFAGSQVEVTVLVSNDMQDKITTDSRASIGSLSLLGAAVLDISPAGTGRTLQDWDYVTARRPTPQFADVANTANQTLEETMGLLRDLRGGRGTAGKLFTDDQLYRELTTFTTSAQQVVDALNRPSGTLGRLITRPDVHDALRASLDNLNNITSRLNAGEGSLGRLLTDDSFSQSLSATTKSLDELTARMNRGEGTIGKMMTDDSLFNRLNAVSQHLDQTLTSLNDGQGTAGQLLRDKQLYENMNAAVREVRDLFAEIKKDPKRYLNVRVSIF
jgi:phospholipid/cholesterol/gamma-HCH transport system substrate-binding protein